MGRYKYTPLDAATGEIRLIRLLPGGFSDDIEIEIFHATSHSKEELRVQKKGSKSRSFWYRIAHRHKSLETPSYEPLSSYEALSYVWGSQANPASVTIRQKGKPKHSTHLQITQNLAEALRYLRKEDESRILWVDAVCINQQDLGERGVQVVKMGDIFKNASQVNVWLGPEAGNSNVAVELINVIAADLVAASTGGGHWTGYFRNVLPGSETAKLLDNLDVLIPKLKALRELCKRKWFTRLWIYQEFHLSQRAIASVGRQTFDVRDLYAVLRFVDFRSSSESKLIRPMRGTSFLPNLLQTLKPPISCWEFIRSLKHSSCSDDRDRVYSILGLLDPKFRDEIVPDYTKTTKQVYKEFFLCSLRTGSSEASMARCGEYSSEVPSWIPNLASTVNTLDWCRASGKSRHEISYMKEDNSLRMPAVAVGKIAKIWFSAPAGAGYRRILDTCLSQIPAELRDAPYSKGGSMLDAYICSMAGGAYQELVRKHGFLPLQELSKIFLRGEYSEEALARTSVTFRHLPRSSIFSTTDGLIGICPSTGNVGDQIYVTLGVGRGILLSEVQGQSNRYRIKGECYVHGLMNAEALLGDLDAVESEGAWSYNIEKFQGTYDVVYTNNGITTQNDPRLGPLPEGWKKRYSSIESRRCYNKEFETDGTMRRLCFQNLSTNEITFRDPRLTSEALKAKGVHLEDIIIV